MFRKTAAIEDGQTSW